MTLKLQRHSRVVAPSGPVVVVVLDGVGIGRRDEGDAVHVARTPTLDRLDREALRTTLLAHGTHVGMPSDDDMGNSEVGHNALGAGRIFSQGALLVEQALRSGALFESAVWREVLGQVASGKTLHFIGLLSDGNVHSHIEHLFAMIREADRAGVGRLRVHPLLDGRDVGATTALDYIGPTEALLSEVSARPDRDYRIGSGGGRMFVTMDRYESDWSIVERGWHAHVLGRGRHFASARDAIETFRRETPGISDQVLPPFVVADHGEPVGAIQDGDAVVLFNFRGDRALQLTRAFEQDAFTAFDRVRRPQVMYAGMMQYDGDLGLPSRFLVSPPAIDRTLGEYLAGSGVSQLALSETQKYGHVTYFWNGNRTEAFDEGLETYVEIPSDRVDFSERPWMKAAEITDATLAALKTGKYQFARINYANGDMVGHTGNFEATVIAVEAVDLALGRLLAGIGALGGVTIVTADHGNADQMGQVDKKTNAYQRDANGSFVPLTSHTLNPVPLWIVDERPERGYALNEAAMPRRLSNVAATALLLLGYEPPADYDAPLIVPK